MLVLRSNGITRIIMLSSKTNVYTRLEKLLSSGPVKLSMDLPSCYGRCYLINTSETFCFGLYTMVSLFRPGCIQIDHGAASFTGTLYPHISNFQWLKSYHPGIACRSLSNWYM